MFIVQKLFRPVLLGLFLVELLSLAGFVYPWLNTAAFLAIIAGTLILSLMRLEWGLYVALAELFIGSFGRLFSVEIEGVTVSIRIGLFIVIMSVWLMKSLHQIPQIWTLKATKSVGGISCQPWRYFVSSKLGKLYTALSIILLFGLIHGLVRHDFGLVFFDFNNWLYLLYLLPFYSVFVVGTGKFRTKGLLAKNEEKLPVTSYQLPVTNVLTILAAAVIVVSVKTLALEWLFAHQTAFAFKTIYYWVRDFGIGEITFYARNFYRVFMQGQIWLMVGFFIFLGILMTDNLIEHSKGNKLQIINNTLHITYKDQNQKLQKRIILSVLILSSTALIISFSRSLWLGWVAGLAVFFALLLFRFEWPLKKILMLGIKFLGVLALQLLLILAVINTPPVTDGGDLGSLVSDRLTQVEAAGSSRLNLLEPLIEEILKNPVIGSGFGTTVTYRSVDPRILNTTPGQSGEYTTYAFEWAYLDVALKVGLIGLMALFGLLWQLGRQAWQKLKFQISDFRFQICFGLWLALIALVITNITTPYLNHPLGLGFLILMIIILERERLKGNPG